MKKLSLFSTPKRAVLTMSGLMLLLIVLVAGSAVAVSAVAEQNAVGEEMARQVALADAGVAEDAANISRTEFDFEKGHFVYEVKMEADGKEYEYLINAKDGSIMEKEVHAEHINSTPSEAPTAKPTQDSQAVTYIGLEAAKTAALTDAGVKAEDANFTKAELDVDRDEAVYEIEFGVYANGVFPNNEGREYEYEVDAVSGEIKEKQFTSYPAPGQSSGKTHIGLPKAKELALADAGVSAEKVTFTEGKLDSDDGVDVYELEFFTANREYDYQIHALTGQILEKDSEPISAKASAAPTAATKYIGIDKAKAIAASHAGVKTDKITFTKAKLEKDDGVVTYELEFYQGNTEYEYTVEAYTGKILEYDSEVDND